jgi:transcriptional regulator with XRE-family HTH domain
MDTYQKCFIENLKYYRKQAGLSQAKLAELCDVSNGTIGNIECGVTKPSFDLMILIARVLHVQPEQLFHFTQHYPELPPQQQKLSESQLQILKDSLTHAIQDVLDKMKQ